MTSLPLKWDVVSRSHEWVAPVVLVLVAQALAPLSVFIPQLVRAKRGGLREYGQLASDT